MRLKQLHEYLGELIASGIDPETIVCLIGNDVSIPVEVDQCAFVSGPYLEDPAPKIPAPLARDGDVLLFLGTDSDVASLDSRIELLELPVAIPEKTWPNGWGN